MKIGLISDTHGLLRKEALTALDDSNLIIHAGDVGSPDIIEQLQAIAPVVAVKGNIDKESWAAGLPETAVAEASPVTIYVLHDLNRLDLNPAAAGFQIVVSGHSHKHSRKDHDGVLYLNPGSAGPQRFRLPITLARMNLARSPWEVEFVQLA